MACSPSCTTSSRTLRFDLRTARPIRSTSFGSSSTWRMVGLLSFIICGGQLNPEPTALTGLGFEADASRHAFGPLPDESQTHARPRIRVVAVQSLEQPEYFFLMFR